MHNPTVPIRASLTEVMDVVAEVSRRDTARVESVVRRLQGHEGVTDVLRVLADRGVILSSVHPGGFSEENGLEPLAFAFDTYRTEALRPRGKARVWPPLEISYAVEGTVYRGTFADWAERWEEAAYSHTGIPGEIVYAAPGGNVYRVYVDRLTPLGLLEQGGGIDYRLWLAGEVRNVRLDGDA